MMFSRSFVRSPNPLVDLDGEESISASGFGPKDPNLGGVQIRSDAGTPFGFKSEAPNP